MDARGRSDSCVYDHYDDAVRLFDYGRYRVRFHHLCGGKDGFRADFADSPPHVGGFRIVRYLLQSRANPIPAVIAGI